MSQTRRFSRRTRPEDESVKEVADLALQIAWKSYDSSMEDKRALDQKANMVLVTDGVLLGLVINSLGVMELHLALLSLALITLSGTASIHALGFRQFKYLMAGETWNQFKLNNRLNNLPQAKIDTMATLDLAVTKNKDQSEDIVRSTKVAIAFLLASLFVTTGAIFAHNAQGIFSF